MKENFKIMLQIQLKLHGTNKTKLINFFYFLKHYSIKWKLNFFQSFIFQFMMKLKKFTVLKSPHVHKKAQEHFSLIKVMTFLNFDNFLRFNNIFLFFKYVTFILFELKFKLNLQFFRLEKKMTLSSFSFRTQHSVTFKVNPNNYLVKNQKNLNDYIQLFDCFGELNLLVLNKFYMFK